MSEKIPTTLLRCAAFLVVGVATVMCNGFFIANAMAAGDNQTVPIISEDVTSSQATKPEENVTTTQTPKQSRDFLKKYCKKADSFQVNPGKNDVVTQQEAIAVAKKTVIREFALTDATLKKFIVCASLWEYTKSPNHSEWIVEMVPADKAIMKDGQYQLLARPSPLPEDDLGCYIVHINSRSGDIIKLSTAADAVG